MTDISKEAVKQLTSHQQQLDAEGIMVGVSRQALDETLSALIALQSRNAELEAASAWSTDLEAAKAHDGAVDLWVKLPQPNKPLILTDCQNGVNGWLSITGIAVLNEQVIAWKPSDTGPTPPTKEDA